ncbi:MAG: S41 family peptidase [Bacteriovoracaceae bacterium]|nr:S41 family peptidase [Bacteriovoracaceae bacterium]
MKKIVLTSVLLLSLATLTMAAQKKSRFEKLELFNKILYLIESQYYREVDTGKLIEGAIKGMMETLDPHSAYLNAELFQKVEEDTSGEFGGLGIEVTHRDGILHVITPIEDTPAYKAGVKAKDKIVEINHESTVGMTLEDAVKKMQGPEGSKVHMGIKREGKDGIINFEIARAKIKIKAVKAQVVRDNFAYIRLTHFQKDSTESIVKALQDMNSKTKIKGIVLDLRANPGGLLDQAVDVSSIFLKDGIVVSTEARDITKKDIRYVKKMGYKDLETPLVVLINGTSASASEIVAGALQDYKRAIIMGTQSFGKGSVQTVAKIDEENGVKLTIAQYMTPTGRKIQAVGIRPDVELFDIDSEVVEDSKHAAEYIREKDLKNHLTATIETEEEKKIRLAQESEERKSRIERVRKKKLAKSKGKKEEKEEDIFKKYEPADDFQVIQAINYLNTFKVFKEFIKGNG